MTSTKDKPEDPSGTWEVKSRYEIVFSVFLLMLAFLFRNHTLIVYPHIFYIFAAFLAFNLVYNQYLKQLVRHNPLSFSPIFVNGILITWAVNFSGGPESYLWVMYLLPIFTACLLYNNRGILLSTTFVLVLFTSVYGRSVWDVNAVEGLQLFGKLSLLVLSAALTSRLASVERRMEQERRLRRKQFDTSLGRLWGESAGSGTGDSLVSMAVHDVNAALAVVLGSSQLLRTQADSDEGRLEDLSRIDSAVRLGKVILQNLVLLGKMDVEWPLERASPFSVLEESLDQCRAEIRSKRIRLEESQGKQARKEGMLSVPLLRQALLNVLFAAISTTPAGGRIRVLSQITDSRRFELVVEDGGVQVGKEDQAHFFDPQWIAPGRGKGVGLGLHLAREIIRQHQGELEVASLKEGGNILIAKIPLTDAPPKNHIQLSHKLKP